MLLDLEPLQFTHEGILGLLDLDLSLLVLGDGRLEGTLTLPELLDFLHDAVLVLSQLGESLN